MPLYEVTLEQEYFGQQIINKWNYDSGTIPSGSLGALLALVGMGWTPFGDIDAFGADTIAGQLQAGQATAVNFVQAIAKNLYSVTDFYTYAFPPNTAGANGGVNPMSPMVAYGFATDRTRSDIRRGQKRFVGVTEADVGGGGILLDATKTYWQALGDTMADINAVPVEGSAVTFTPYVFGRVAYTTDSGKTAYKYYDTEVEQRAHIARINQWTLKSAIRSQTSRQYGRGS